MQDIVSKQATNNNNDGHIDHTTHPQEVFLLQEYEMGAGG